VRILYTDEIPADGKGLSRRERSYLYNGLDCLICREVFDQTHPQLDATTSVTYRFMLALQAPVFEIQLRGCLVDRYERREKIKLLESQLLHVERILNFYAKALWGKPLNARSWRQKASLLYDFAQCAEITKFDHRKGLSKRTTERDAIERLSKKYFNVRPICLCILAIMDLSKQLGMLKAGIDPDGYFRASFGIAGTETGRLNSKKNVFGTGSNFQNIPEKLRSIFTAPLGPMPRRSLYER